jgi:hypothetical protein
VNILLTGASGVVGTDLTILLESKNHKVIPMLRCSSSGKYLVSQDDLQSTDLVIHAGVPSHPRISKKRKEYFSNSIELLEKVRKANASLIFISSHSSRVDNFSQYSRDKHFLEKQVLEMGFSVLRIGVFASSDDLKPSLVVRFVNFFGSSVLHNYFQNLPTTNSENIASSVQAIHNHEHKFWNCFSVLNSKHFLEGNEVSILNSNCLRAVNFIEFNQKQWLINFVNLLNKLTFSLIDPLINLLYDLKHYAK